MADDVTPWSELDIEERHEALLSCLLAGASPLGVFAARYLASQLDIIEHMASDEFTKFADIWKARLSVAANHYAGLIQHVQILMTVPESGAKAAMAAKDGYKLFSDVSKEIPTVDPRANTSDEQVQAAADLIQANLWKTKIEYEEAAPAQSEEN